MKRQTVLVIHPVMIAGVARKPGEVVEVSVSEAGLLRGLGRAVPSDGAPAPAPTPALEREPEEEAKPRKRTRARTVIGQYQGDDPETPEVNEAWVE